MLGQGLINVQYLQGIELQDTIYIVLNEFCLTKKGQEKSSTKRKKCLNIEGEETDTTMRFTEYFLIRQLNDRLIFSSKNRTINSCL